MNDPEILTTAGICFRLLSACFYEPEKDLLQEQQVCSNLRRLLDSLDADAAVHADKMAEDLNNLEQQQLTLDYAALFIGPFELLAPPYGSVYLEKKREVMGETTIEVLKLYQDAGLQVEESEPADHIAIELEFMSFLHDQEAAALREGSSGEAHRWRELRERFFSRYLGSWISEFCGDIRDATGNPFYLALADCLDGFIRAYRQQAMASEASL